MLGEVPVYLSQYSMVTIRLHPTRPVHVLVHQKINFLNVILDNKRQQHIKAQKVLEEHVTMFSFHNRKIVH